MKVTGATITDEQIREIRARTGWRSERAQRDQATIATALSTPSWFQFDANRRDAARAQCAEWWNARFGDTPFRNIHGGACSAFFVVGRVVDARSIVHGRQMGSVYPQQPADPYLGVHCGQVTGLRPIDFRYDLRVTCWRCAATLEKIFARSLRVRDNSSSASWRDTGEPAPMISRDGAL